MRLLQPSVYMRVRIRASVAYAIARGALCGQPSWADVERQPCVYCLAVADLRAGALVGECVQLQAGVCASFTC